MQLCLKEKYITIKKVNDYIDRYMEDSEQQKKDLSEIDEREPEEEYKNFTQNIFMKIYMALNDIAIVSIAMYMFANYAYNQFIQMIVVLSLVISLNY